MKASLNFDLDDPDDRMAHFRCVKALDMALCLFDTSEMLRALSKSDNPDLNFETLDIVRKEFHNILESRGVVIDELSR